MTAIGLAKLKSENGDDFTPAIDYDVKEYSTAECMPLWLPFPDKPSTQHFSHTDTCQTQATCGAINRRCQYRDTAQAKPVALVILL